MFIAIVLFSIAIAAGFAVIVIYNRLIEFKNAAAKCWSNVGVLLKQRHDELPKLVEVCKGYMKHERETLESVIAARSAVHAANESGDVRGLGAAETGLRSQLGKLFAVAEAYPDLKANTIFLQLQTRISGLETSIADRREIYNDAANSNNTAIEQFPAVVIAGMFGFRACDLFEFDASSIADVDMKTLLAAQS